MAQETVVDDLLAQADGTQPPADADTPDDFFVGTYRTREDAEKGNTEKDETINRLKSERDKATAEAERVRNDLLEKLAANATSNGTTQQKQKSQDEINAQIDKLAEQIDEGGGKAVLDVLGAYVQDVEESLNSKYEKSLEDIKAQLGGVVQTVQERDPDYVARKETVAQLEKMGLDRSTAMEVAKLVKPEIEQPSRPMIAGNTAGIPAPSGNQSKLTQETVGALEGLVGKLSPEETAALSRKS